MLPSCSCAAPIDNRPAGLYSLPPMKRSWFAPLLITLLAIAPAGARESEEAIKDWSEQFVAAWNRDDAKALANLWTEDGDLINPFGRHANGRAQIEQLLESEHTAQMKSTVYKIT